MRIIVRGDSVAAWCCTHLLNRAGFKPVLERTGRARLPAIMLSDAALNLMRDVFDRPDLFLAAPRVKRRVVKWGKDAKPLALAHSAVVVPENELLRELAQHQDFVDEAGSSKGDLTIFAARPLPPETVQHCFGTRVASAAKVRLKNAGDSETCWIESLEEGWLFLVPDAIDSGWLLSVGCPLPSVAQQSRLIAQRIVVAGDPAGEFAASPRIVSPLCGMDWLACGTAGMAFDPICGDGTSHAVREAILASAVVQAMSLGGDAQELCSHYEARLTMGFQRHLEASLEFYQAGNSGPWWKREVASLEHGLEWCSGKLSKHGRFRYRLDGFELKPIDRESAC